MLVPLSWLKDYVDIDIPVEQLAERLTLAGLEVAHIRYIGIPQVQVPGVRSPRSDHLVWDREKILLGAIREVRPHPNADKLVLAMVDYGDAALEPCVTGAPNLFGYRDQGPLAAPLWAPFAMEGAEVWDGHSDTPKRMVLKSKSLRGIENRSMVCSEKELGISDEHEGILLLDARPDYRPGMPFQDVLGDAVFDIELTPNLGHCFSVLGIAREVATLFDKPLREPAYPVRDDGPPIGEAVRIDIQEPALNPRFTLALLRGATVRPSPFWMQHRLRLVGQRPINNFVDITNYVTFDIGQPLHAFDYDALVARAGGEAPTIITRRPHAGETLTTLDGVTRTLAPHTILVCDTAGVLSLGGLIGGAETEISESTTNVLLEAANWDFITLRRVSQEQKVFTEAGTRFSRNIHPSRAILGVRHGIALMQQMGGGQIAGGILDAYPLPPAPVGVSLMMADVERLLGMTVPLQTAVGILARLGFDITIADEHLHLVVPDYRTDISTGDVGVADVVEELVRIIGYDSIPNKIMADALPPQRANPALDYEEAARDTLVQLGLREVISYRFTTPEVESRLTPEGSAPSLPDAMYVTMANPISSDKTVLRHTLLANLLQNAWANARFIDRQQIFEIGKVYLRQAGAALPDEPLRLGILMAGPRAAESWQDATTADGVDFFDLKGVIEGFLSALHVPGVTYQPAQHSSFHPGRSATLLIDEVPAGTFGELHPEVARAFRLEGAVQVAEIDLEAVWRTIPARYRVLPIPVTPAVLEDIALIVRDDIPAAQVEAVIREAGGDMLKSVQLFDVYTGDPIPAGHRSLAYALTYQTDAQTLTDKMVARIRGRIVARADQLLGAQLRS
jgi:phenylalanyl-tRNA synthetase beta chain